MSNTQTTKLKIALVGAGRIGKRWAYATKNMRGVSLVLVCDKNHGKAKALAQEFKGVEILTDWKKCALRSDIHAAIIGLPHAYLAPAAKSFLKNGKHVLSEKPGAIRASEIKELIVLARENGLRYMVGFNHRFHDGFLRARKFFDKGTIGKPLFIRACYGFGGRKGYEKEWRFNKRLSGGGELIDQGVHMIDLSRWFLGEFYNVRGFTNDLFWKQGVEDNAFVLLKTKKGRIASIHVSLTQWKPLHRFEIYGTRGYLIVSGLGRKYGGGERLIVGKRKKDYTAEERIIQCDANADKSLARELGEFLAAIREKRDSKPNGVDALRTLEIVEMIYASDKKKN